jgi:hypothetical protein
VDYHEMVFGKAIWFFFSQAWHSFVPSSRDLVACLVPIRVRLFCLTLSAAFWTVMLPYPELSSRYYDFCKFL